MGANAKRSPPYPQPMSRIETYLPLI